MTGDERRLLKHFRALSEAGRNSLLDYAEFLSTRDNGRADEISETPLDIPRPAEESVVKAIKRLMATYPMLERDKLLNETSAMMTRHVVHKHPAPGVIDELEAFFRKQYDLHRQNRSTA